MAAFSTRATILTAPARRERRPSPLSTRWSSKSGWLSLTARSASRRASVFRTTIQTRESVRGGQLAANGVSETKDDWHEVYVARASTPRRNQDSRRPPPPDRRVTQTYGVRSATPQRAARTCRVRAATCGRDRQPDRVGPSRQRRGDPRKRVRGDALGPPSPRARSR